MARTIKLDLDLGRGTLLERGTGKPPFIFCGDGVDVGIALFNNGELVGTSGDTFTVTFKSIAGQTLATANSGGAVITPTQYDDGAFNATVAFSSLDVAPGDHKIEITISGDNVGTFVNTCKFREPVYRGPTEGLTNPDSPIVDADTHVYYRADGYNDVTGEWTDRSGKAGQEDPDRNLELVEGTAPELTSSWSGGRPAVRFDGSNVLGKHILNSSWLASPTASYSVFIVGDLTDTGGTRSVWFGRRSTSSSYHGGIYSYHISENEVHHFKDDVDGVGRALSGKTYVSGEKFIYGVRVVSNGDFNPARDRDTSATGNCNQPSPDNTFLARWTMGGSANEAWDTFTGSHIGHVAALVGYVSTDIGVTLFGDIFEYFKEYYNIPIT